MPNTTRIDKHHGVRPKRRASPKLDGKEEEIRMLLENEVSKAAVAQIVVVSRTALHHFIRTRKLYPKVLKDRDRNPSLGHPPGALEPWVAEVLSVCTSGDGHSGRRWLDLSGLTFVDQAGAKLLKDLIRGGIEISACSGFVAELLHLEKS